MNITVRMKIVPFQLQKINQEDTPLKKCHWETSIPKKFHPFKDSASAQVKKAGPACARSASSTFHQPKSLQELENEYHKQRGSLAKRSHKKIKTIVEPQVSWPLNEALRIKG
jgi:hypothetical protein